jgi:ATP-binding cassette subfamily B protein RaxB
MVASYHGHEMDLNALRRRFSISLKGTTLKTILLMAERLGLSGRPLRLEPAGLAELGTPTILHWNMNHFVVLAEADAKTALIHDPASGARSYSLEEISKHFTGVALELVPTDRFEQKHERIPLRLQQLVGRIPAMARSIAQALVLSLLLQMFVLVSPFYIQLTIDHAITKGDGTLLIALAVGFAFLALLKFGVDWLRSLVLLHFASVLNFRIGANLFHHLVRLPLEWFEKRHVGDLVARFGSTQPIRSLIAEGAVAALVDGLMAALTLTMLFIYSSTLAWVALAGFLVSGGLRLGTFRFLRRREEEAIVALAQEQTSFIETARAIHSLKVFGAEPERERLWLNRHAEAIAKRARLGRLQALLRTGTELIGSLELVLLVYLAAQASMRGGFTIGMIFAFIAYRQQFADKTTKLIDAAIQYRMLDLHLDRIADIALSEPEAGIEPARMLTHRIRGGIELCAVSYRYAETEADVLDQVSLKIDAGEFVAITGPSGGGKTTLLKVMLGLLTPQSGHVLIDGEPLSRIGTAALRAACGVVLQDDQLLSGSIAENIAMFEPQLDIRWIRECARVAGIDGEIVALPMDYNTHVGDMGAALSGGQKQRILLARALYRRPRFLFMDEGTNQVDVTKEREMNAALSQLPATRIVIAHRPDTILAAGRIIELRGGRITT